MGPVGIGIDVVDVERLRRVLGRRPRLAERLFGPEEVRRAAGMVDPWPSLAGRFAVKEAVLKALGLGLGAVPLAEIGVHPRPGGQPELRLGPRAGDVAARAGVRRWHVSISHTGALAEAVVLAWGLSPSPPAAEDSPRVAGEGDL